MSSDTKSGTLQNLLITGLCIVVTLFSAYHEGYVPLISPLFWCSLLAAFSLCVWLAFTISTRRLLALTVTIFTMEYIKETIGIRSGMWIYHGVNGLYSFGVWAWVLGGLTAFFFSTKLVIRLLRRLRLPRASWPNAVLLVLIFMLIPLTLGEYREGAGVLFWSFYALLLAAGIHASLRMDLSVFAGIVIAAWVVGNPSEYLGSVPSRVWTFPHDPDYPPFFLLAGCWPLEILAQYAVSAFLADEPLEEYTS